MSIKATKRVEQIVLFSHAFVIVGIKQNKFISQTFCDKSICNGCANVAQADNGKFSHKESPQLIY